MRRHGWQLPYHPLQVVSIAVFLALGFAFYVFFAPFVGKKLIQHVALGIYTPLIFCVFLLYIWCAATDPGDAGVLTSNKYLGIEQSKECRRQEESTFEADCRIVEDDPANKGSTGNVTACLSPRNYKQRRKSSTCKQMLILSIGWCPLLKCSWQEQSSEQNASEDGMFYCSLCKVEVSKFSKHCRVCDKCVNGFDHHCRWLNNCIGRRNYGRFFILMAAALLLLIFQWSVGIEVLILCFLEQKQFKMDIVSKLGSSFSLVPFVIVVTSCTILAILATLPLAQLFFFHVLLIKKGISTYDYIIALRELEQQGNGAQQSPQMSPVSSLTGLSSASSLNAFRRAAWCTPPRLFLEDQFDIVSQEASMPSNFTGMKTTTEEPRKKSAAAVKISPWALAKLNVEEVSKVAAEARKRSKILKPILRQDIAQEQETDSSFGSDSGRFPPKSNLNPPLAKICYKTKSSGGNWSNDKTNKLGPLQLEARSAFTASRAMFSSGIAAISPDSSLGSPEIHPFHVSSSTVEEERNLKLLPPSGSRVYSGIQLSRSNSDGYDASGGEDSDQFTSGIIPRSVNWNSLPFNSGRYSIE